MRRTVCLLGVLLLSLLAAAPAVAAEFDPYDFEVQLEGDPGIAAKQEPTCSDDGAGTQTCSLAFDFAESGKAMSGTVRSKSKGLSGSIKTTCDMDMHVRQSFRFGAAGGEVLEFTGSGSQSCSWLMDFGGSTLAGTIAGTMKMGLVSATTAFFGGRFDVIVVAGTGEFDGMVGGGVFDEYETFDLLGGGGAPPPPEEPPADRMPPAEEPPTPPEDLEPPEGFELPADPAELERGLEAFARSRKGSSMRLRLRRGAPLARIVELAAKLERSSDVALRVVTDPGASCTASAAGAGRKVALGAAADRNRDGQVVFAGRLARKLGAGTWTVSVSCGSARDRVTVRIA